MIEQIIAGAVAGLGYAIVGWQTKDENPDWIKLVKTIAISTAVGAIAGYSMQDFNVLMTGTAGIAVTKVVNMIGKICVKYYKKFSFNR